jgi:hypothetical protein
MATRYIAFTEFLNTKLNIIEINRISPPPLAESDEYAADFVKFIIRCDGVKWLLVNLNV